MSKRSSKNYNGFAFPFVREASSILFISVFALTGCLGSDGGNPDCEPVSFTKTITPIKIQNKNHVYFDPGAFDFMFKSNVVINDVSFQGVTSGKRSETDRSDDLTFDVNGTKCSRNDGERNVKWNCGNGVADSTQTRFCSPMHKFGLNGGLNILTFMLTVKLQKGQLRLSAHAPKEPTLSQVSIVVSGIEHPKTCPKPPDNPPPTPVAPVTAITAYDPTASPSSSMAKSISFVANQTGVSYSCSLDNEAFAACTSPKLYSGLSSGSHTFRVKATNAAGLSDANPPSLTWVVDTQPPSVTITNMASLPTLTNLTDITMLFTSSESGSTFTCALDANAAVACASPFSLSGLSEGTHKVTVTAIDSVGNASANPASFQWAIDVTAPTTTINQVAPVQAINNSSTMNFQFSASETATFDCAIDNGAYSACVSPYNLTGVSEGSHWFSVRANDAAGNQGQPVTYSWKTDTTAPVVTIVSTTPAAGNSNAHNVAVDFATAEPASFMCSFDGAAAVACASPFTAPIVVEGDHSLVVTATDVAGNAGTGTTIAWFMDFTSPILSLGQILPSAALYKNSSTVSMEVLSNEAVTMTAAVNGTDLGGFTSPLTLDNLAEGSYSVVISALDGVGNTADSLTYNFFVDVTAPTISLSSAITGLTNLDHNTLTFSSGETATFACNIDEAGFGACLSPLTLSGLADGVHNAVVRATDVAGNVSAEQSVQWTVDATPPLTTATSTQNGHNSFTFNFSSNESGTFQCSLDGAPAQACTSPVTVQNLVAAPHTFVVQAIDVAGNMDSNGAAINFAVNAPTTTLTANRTGNNALSFTFASDVSGATFLCSLDGQAAAVCASPYDASGMSVAVHSIFVQAKDAAGNIDPNGATYAWTVRGPITTTMTSVNPSLAFTKLNSMSIGFTSNYNDATFLCSLNGAAAAACTSPINYTGLNDGAKTFVVRAVDPWGVADATGVTYTWTVDTVAPTLVSQSTAATSTTFTVNWTTNEPTTTKLFWGVSPSTANVFPEDNVYTTTHQVRITGLNPNTLYTFRPAGTDRAGNVFTGSIGSVRTSR